MRDFAALQHNGENEKSSQSQLAEAEATTTSVASHVATIHRVHTTGNMQQQDDYITAKQLTPSAHERLAKRTSTTTEEQHYCRDDNAGFYGSYANIRKKLDYTYHVHYRKQRQWLHDCIIEDCLLKHQRQDEQHSASLCYHLGNVHVGQTL